MHTAVAVQWDRFSGKRGNGRKRVSLCECLPDRQTRTQTDTGRERQRDGWTGLDSRKMQAMRACAAGWKGTRLELSSICCPMCNLNHDSCNIGSKIHSISPAATAEHIFFIVSEFLHDFHVSLCNRMKVMPEFSVATNNEIPNQIPRSTGVEGKKVELLKWREGTEICRLFLYLESIPFSLMLCLPPQGKTVSGVSG